ncbi:MAG: small multi-drug export protein [Candidatus Nanoarchaeia archaeon]|nr:small multi-drug export protein [Candidatus Nanoarchaeia archaeon]
MFYQILILILLTFIPFLELRFSIPAGILTTTVSLPFNQSISGMGLNPILVIITCIFANIILGIIIYQLIFFIKKYLIHFPKINFLLDKFLNKAHKKVKPFKEKYGILGIALFIAVPLPGSGSYSGALGSYMLGLTKKEFYLANTIGVILAGIIVALITLGIFSFI